jgi:hypothetical protein
VEWLAWTSALECCHRYDQIERISTDFEGVCTTIFDWSDKCFTLFLKEEQQSNNAPLRLLMDRAWDNEAMRSCSNALLSVEARLLLLGLKECNKVAKEFRFQFVRLEDMADGAVKDVTSIQFFKASEKLHNLKLKLFSQLAEAYSGI